ncbi:MAG: CubicO group peptidase (beta-lactamase class C family) [Paracoccaceae bacterium]|jgi:CubicO group peptidase (beta-lactamase class C family)
MKDEIGWSFVAMKDGEVVSERHEGFADRDRTKAWKAETMAPVWSATKGPMAVCVLMALHRAGMDGESMVERVWPELRVGSLTFEEMFSHQGGLAGLHEKCSIWDREAVVASLEKQEPLWEVGTHGYHPRTIGFLADEVVRRVDGRGLGTFWREEIGEPEEIDFWIGLPEEEHERVAQLVPARFGRAGEPKPFYEALLNKNSLTRLAFSSPSDLAGVSEMNQPRAWKAGFPAMGGVGSARGLAKFYDWLLRQDFLEELLRKRVKGLDVIQRVESSFGFGMMLGLGPEGDCFGHPGAGGSYGLANVEKGMSYGFVMNYFESNLYPSEERLALVGGVG